MSHPLVVYGASMKKDKPRDIARGVLPSTARKGARDKKRNFHKTHRACQRRVNHELLRAGLEHVDDVETQLVYDGYHASTQHPSLSWDETMPDIIDARRSADKLGPLLAWGRSTHDRLMTKPEWPVEDKIAYFKALLPDTLQGRHALGHLLDMLRLSTDNFYYYSRYDRFTNRLGTVTKDDLRAALIKILSTSKGRMEFHDFRLRAIPVAGHSGEANNKVQIEVQAVDENGEPRFLPNEEHDPVTGTVRRYLSARPVMVQVLIPQVVAVTCDDCSFMRNDPLATPEAINRFVDFFYSNNYSRSRYRKQNGPGKDDSAERQIHATYMREVADYIRPYLPNEVV